MYEIFFNLVRMFTTSQTAVTFFTKYLQVLQVFDRYITSLIAKNSARQRKIQVLYRYFLAIFLFSGL